MWGEPPMSIISGISLFVALCNALPSVVCIHVCECVCVSVCVCVCVCV